MRQHIGIYGGTFDPPHFGHVIAVKQAKKLLGLDRVIVVPASVPPHKEDSGVTAEQRLALARTAFRRVKYAEVSDIELRREGPSYTADTLIELREEYPDALFFLICGSDMFLNIASWRRAEEIFASCLVVGLGREQGETDEMKRYGAFLFERFGAEYEVLDNPIVPISSTEIRALLAKHENSKFLPPDVYDEIKELGLYGT